MKEELVHMDNNKKKDETEVPISVNTQMMIGVVIVGVMMFRFNQKLNILARSQISVIEGIKQLAEATINEDTIEETTT